MPNSSANDAQNLRETFSRYRPILERLLRPALVAEPFTADAEDADRVQVERGILFPQLLLDPARSRDYLDPAERLITLSTPERVSKILVVDRTGHERPLYRPLLVYCWLQAFRQAYELLPRAEFGRWEEATRVWCDDLERRLGEFAWPPDALPAALGDAAAEACWMAAALQVAGKVFIRDAWTDLAGDVFGKLARRQQPSGAFLAPGLSDNPETRWYHELALLHAAATHAVQAEDRALAAAVRRATTYHLQETQPDHATNQPWALFAFLWNPEARLLADGMLHAVESLGEKESAVSLMLLADALYCVKLFGI